MFKQTVNSCHPPTKKNFREGLGGVESTDIKDKKRYKKDDQNRNCKKS